MSGVVQNRYSDSFNTGLTKFRSRYFSSDPNYVRYGNFASMGSYEAWGRVGGFMGREHYLGAGVGMVDVPDLFLREIRPDGSFLNTNWSFYVPYFYISYHYIRPFRLRLWHGGWRWELGGGMGFVPQVRWRVNGIGIDKNSITGIYEPDTLNASQSSRTGSLLRLEGGLSKQITRSLFLRAGVSLFYGRAGYFTGTVKGADGDWYYMKNGGLIPISDMEFSTIGVLSADPLFASALYPTLSHRPDITFSMSGIYLSLGVRL